MVIDRKKKSITLHSSYLCILARKKKENTVISYLSGIYRSIQSYLLKHVQDQDELHAQERFLEGDHEQAEKDEVY
jgi:hypothetical protein